MTLLPRGGDRGHRRETAELDGVPPRSRGARRGMAPNALRREKTPRDLTRVCVLSVEKTRFVKLRARPSPAKTEVEGVGSRRIGRVRDARKSSTREPRRVTRNHDSLPTRVSSRRATTFLADTRVRNRRLTHHHGPHHLPLRLLLPRRLPRGGRRASLAPLSSPLSRRSNTRAAASVAAEKEVALTFRALHGHAVVLQLPRPFRRDAPHERRAHRKSAVHAAHHPSGRHGASHPPLPRPSTTRRCFFDGALPAVVSRTGPRKKASSAVV